MLVCSLLSTLLEVPGYNGLRLNYIKDTVFVTDNSSDITNKVLANPGALCNQ